MVDLLLHAVKLGDIAEVKLLLEAGVNPNARTLRKSRNLLGIALENHHEEIAIALIEAGTNVNQQDDFSFSENMKQPIHYAAMHNSVSIIAKLLEKGVNVDSQDYTQITALQYAASFGWLDCTQFLVEQGANIDHRSKSGRSALWKAAERGHVDIVNYLHNCGANINVQNILFESILTDCIEDPNMVQQLIMLGININMRDISGQHSLHVAAAIAPVDTTEILLYAGSSADIQDDSGNTPLHVCAMQGRYKVATRLLNWGAKVNAANRARMTPIHMAVNHNCVNLIELFFSAGARLSQSDIAIFDSHFRDTCVKLVDYVKARVSQPNSLFSLCVIIIRDSIGTTKDLKIRKLPLPRTLKDRALLL